MIGKVSSITLKVVLGIAVVAGFLYAGTKDFEESVIYGMSQEQYKFIQEKIGKDDRSAIVDEYLSKRDYYDSINYYYLYEE